MVRVRGHRRRVGGRSTKVKTHSRKCFVTRKGDRISKFTSPSGTEMVRVQRENEVIIGRTEALGDFSWEKTGLPNSWESKNGSFVHVFEGHKNGVPTGNWVVRAGKSDEELLKNQKKFKSERMAFDFAREYMRLHPDG